jgi:hypothetical protein
MSLLCWLRLLCLASPLAKAEPRTLRYRLPRTAVRLVRGQRKRKIKITSGLAGDRDKPYARTLTAFNEPIPGSWQSDPPDQRSACPGFAQRTSVRFNRISVGSMANRELRNPIMLPAPALT